MQANNKIIIYHEKNNCQDISSSFLKSSFEKFCRLHLETDTTMLPSYSRIKEYDQTTPVLIDSENADVVMMCAQAASIINGEIAITHKTTSVQK